MTHRPPGGRAVHRRALPLLALALLVVLATGARAHATLESSAPAVDGNAPAGLAVVELRFTEGVERQYTDANVFDLNGTSFRAGAVEFDDADRRVIRLPTQPLPDGIYSVSWQTLSVDTHTLRGQFLFSVGNATLVPAGAVTEHDHAGDGEMSHVSAEGVTRAVFFGGLFVAFGAPLFDLAFDHERGRLSRPLQRATGVLALVGAIAGVLSFWYFVDRAAIDWRLALTTVAGKSLAWRSGLLAVAAALALAAGWVAQGRQRALAGATVAVAFAAIVATSMGSHAAAVEEARTLAIVADAAHLAMAGVWIGGVVAFALIASGRTPRELGLIVARFSPVAVLSVAVVLATGTYASVRHMSAWSDLWSDPYGRLVALKALLIVPLVAMGAYNKIAVGPGLLTGRLDVARFSRVVEVEALLMVAIVVLAGNLSTTPPPAELDAAPGATAAEPFFAEEETRTTHVVLYIAPGPTPVVGHQRFNVQLHPLTPTPVPNATVVALRFAAPGESVGEEVVYPQKVTPGDWRLEGGYLTTPGTWKVHVVMQRPDEYKELVFEVPVAAPGT